MVKYLTHVAPDQKIRLDKIVLGDTGKLEKKAGWEKFEAEDSATT